MKSQLITTCFSDKIPLHLLLVAQRLQLLKQELAETSFIALIDVLRAMLEEARVEASGLPIKKTDPSVGQPDHVPTGDVARHRTMSCALRSIILGGLCIIFLCLVCQLLKYFSRSSTDSRYSL